MKQRTFFAFRFEWSERIAHLAPTVRLEIHEAASHYALNGELPENMSPEALAAFNEYLMPDFRRRAKAAEYRARAKARKAQTATPAAIPAESEKAAEAVAVAESAQPQQADSAVVPGPEQPAEAVPEVPLTSAERRKLKRKRFKARKAALRLERKRALAESKLNSAPQNQENS